MFFIFGPSGQMLRGDADSLAQVARVRRVRRSQALRTRAPDVNDDAQEPAVTLPTRGATAPASTDSGIAAYQRAARRPMPARQPLTRVSDVMTRGCITVREHTRVNDAWQTLAQHRIAQAPVVNGRNQVIGLLMRADMAPLDLLPEPGAIEQAIALARRPVSEVMLSPVPTVSADTELRRVARVFLDTELPGLAVTDETGHCTGFISRSDILQAMVADPPLDLWS